MSPECGDSKSSPFTVCLTLPPSRPFNLLPDGWGTWRVVRFYAMSQFMIEAIALCLLGVAVGAGMAVV